MKTGNIDFSRGTFVNVVMLLMTLCLTTCVGTSRVITGTPLPPTNPSTVKIYTKPPALFKEIAILDSAKTDFIFNPEIHNVTRNKQQIITAMKSQAARLGANGILIRSLEKQSTVIGTGYGLSSSRVSTKVSDAGDDRDNILHGVAIFVIEDEN